MGGRPLLRRGPATTLLALALVLALVLVAALVARPPVASAARDASPVAAAHLVVDEVLPAPAGPSLELRTRLLGPVDLLVAVLLAVVAGLVGMTAVVDRARRAAVDRSVVLALAAPGRAPPRPHLHR